MALNIQVHIENSVTPERAMEVDQELLDQFSESNTTIFRLYQWSSPAITVGRLQNPSKLLDLTKTTKNNIHILKRPTGGRHILHGEDISFSVIIPIKHFNFWGNSVSERHAKLAELFIELFDQLDISLEANIHADSPQKIRNQHGDPCFLSTSQHEITLNSKKLIGFAQLVTSRGVLIQGSMPIHSTHSIVDFEKINLSEKSRRIKIIQKYTTSLADHNNTSSSIFEDMSAAVINYFSNNEIFSAVKILTI